MSHSMYPSQAVRLPPILAPMPTSPLPFVERTHHDSFLHPRTSLDPSPQRLSSSLPSHFHMHDTSSYRNPAGGRGPTLPPLHYVETYNERSPPRALPPLSIPPSPPLGAEHTSQTFSMPSDIEMASPTVLRHQAPTRTMLERESPTRIATLTLPDATVFTKQRRGTSSRPQTPSETPRMNRTRTHGSTYVRVPLNPCFFVASLLVDADQPHTYTPPLLSALRLRIINRLRGKEPTPEPELQRRHPESHPSPGGSSVSF